MGVISNPGVSLLYRVSLESLMPKRLTLLRHLSREELEERDRQASDAVERSQYQILWLLGFGEADRRGTGGNRVFIAMDTSDCQPLQPTRRSRS